MADQTRVLMEAYTLAAEQYRIIELQRRKALTVHMRKLEKTIESLAATLKWDGFGGIVDRVRLRRQLLDK